MLLILPILFLLLFSPLSLSDLSFNCTQHACLRIQACEKSIAPTSKNAKASKKHWYFQILADPKKKKKVKGCFDDYATIVFERETPDVWRIEVAKNASSNRIRSGYEELAFHLTIGAFGITLNMENSMKEIKINATKFTLREVSYENYEDVGLWEVELNTKENRLDLESLDWTEPRMSVTQGTANRKWCNTSTNISPCAVDIRFAGTEIKYFKDKLGEEIARMTTLETDLATTMVAPKAQPQQKRSGVNENCTLSQMEDHCEPDCEKITILNGSIKCASQLWLKGEGGNWWRVDGAKCEGDGRIGVYWNLRILQNSSSDSKAVLHCSKEVPTCHHDIDLLITIGIIYCSVVTVLIAVLYFLLYRSMDKRVGPANDFVPSIYSRESTESKSQRVKAENDKSGKQHVTTPLIDQMKTVVDGNYENMTIR